jgi:flagellar biogenesis protein FliO
MIPNQPPAIVRVRRFVGRAVPAWMVDAVEAEARELVGLVRRIAPTRRRMGILGLALLALLALGGVAGAAEPDPGNRSALEAWSSSPVPASPAPAAAAVPVASIPVEAVAPGAPIAPALSPVFSGPDPLDLVTKGALVAVLLFLTLRVLRRVQGGASSRNHGFLDIIESRPLGSKMQLHLVAVGDRRLVIGQSPAGLVALGELDLADLPVQVTEALEVPEATEAALDRWPSSTVALTGSRPRTAAVTRPSPVADTRPRLAIEARPALTPDRRLPAHPAAGTAQVDRMDRMARLDRALAAADRAADAAERASAAAERAAGIADRAAAPMRAIAIGSASRNVRDAHDARDVRDVRDARDARDDHRATREPAAQVLERILATSRADREAARTDVRTDGRAAERIAERLAARLAELNDANRHEGPGALGALPGTTPVRDGSGVQGIGGAPVRPRRLEVSA